MKIIVAGFDTHEDEYMNPAYEAVKLLPDHIKGAEIIKVEIPTVFGEVKEVIEALIRKEHPDIVLSVGEAGGRADITIERVGINIMDARRPDNKGNQPIDEIIEKDGETVYFSNMPVKTMVNEIRKQGIPASVSYTAGTYVCNYVLYTTMYMINKKYKNIKGGFIHVPFCPEQSITKATNTPTMSLKNIAKALEVALIAVMENEEDIKSIEGCEC